MEHHKFLINSLSLSLFSGDALDPTYSSILPNKLSLIVPNKFFLPPCECVTLPCRVCLPRASLPPVPSPRPPPPLASLTPLQGRPYFCFSYPRLSSSSDVVLLEAIYGRTTACMDPEDPKYAIITFLTGAIQAVGASHAHRESTRHQSWH